MTKRFLFPMLGFFFISIFLYFSSLITLPKSVQGFSEAQELPVKDFTNLLPTPAPYPFPKDLILPLELSAKAVYAIDADSMVSLYSKNADEKLFPASTTKIMTALVALENYSLDQVLVYDGTPIEGNVIGLKPGEQITVRSLLYGALVGSGNEAAYTLASNFPGGTESFVAEMNFRAGQLNLLNTHFTNSMGLDQEGHYSTARDLATLSIYVMKKPIFSEIVSIPEITITDISGTNIYNLKNTNTLVTDDESFKGIKTGWTENAGECLVSYYKANSRRIVTVLLHSEDRIGETKALTGWLIENFDWKTINPQISYR